MLTKCHSSPLLKANVRARRGRKRPCPEMTTTKKAKKKTRTTTEAELSNSASTPRHLLEIFAHIIRNPIAAQSKALPKHQAQGRITASQTSHRIDTQYPRAPPSQATNLASCFSTPFIYNYNSPTHPSVCLVFNLQLTLHPLEHIYSRPQNPPPPKLLQQ